MSTEVSFAGIRDGGKVQGMRGRLQMSSFCDMPTSRAQNVYEAVRYIGLEF